MTEIDIRGERTLTRRRFVLAGGTAAAGLYLAGGLPATALAAGAPAYLRRSSYAGRVGASFVVRGAQGASVTLRLLAVKDLARARQTRSLAGRDDAFALTFSGPVGRPLVSGVHELRHPSLGWISLFVTPTDRPGKAQYYEVVVDRAAAR